MFITLAPSMRQDLGDRRAIWIERRRVFGDLPRHKMTILTNMARFPVDWTAVDQSRGHSITATGFRDMLRHLRHSDVILINSDLKLLLSLAMLFMALPFLRRPLVGSDVVLRAPQHGRRQLTHWLKRLLLARVDHFIHHFKDLSGYQRYFGIGPERSSFVPFKPNLRHQCDVKPNF